MTDRARAEGFERIVVDTSGLVAGGLGVALKGRKIAVVAPDLVLALEREGDCEAMLRPYEGEARPRVVRLVARGRPRSRSQATRRRHRQAALERYLAGARLVSVDRAAVRLEIPAGIQLEACVGALCGLDDSQGDTLALGVVESIHGGRLRVLSPLSPGMEVSRLRIGRERREGTDGGAVDPSLGVRSTPSSSREIVRPGSKARDDTPDVEENSR